MTNSYSTASTDLFVTNVGDGGKVTPRVSRLMLYSELTQIFTAVTQPSCTKTRWRIVALALDSPPVRPREVHSPELSCITTTFKWVARLRRCTWDVRSRVRVLKLGV